MARYLNHWIDGREFIANTENRLESINPSNGQVTANVPVADAQVIAAAAKSAEAAYRKWRHTSPLTRARVLADVAAAIRRNADSLAETEKEETGKPHAVAAGEVEAAAMYFEFFAGLVHAPVGEVLDVGPEQRSFTRREPYGVVGVITPWNGPLSQAARAAAPALAVGNAVVIKPSEATSSATFEVARLAFEAGLPAGLLNVVLGDGPVTGSGLVKDPLVRKVSFTGSVRAGREVAQLAGARVIPLTLELGGKSANIIFEDADLEKAIQGSLRAFTYNSGQVCSAGTRLLVHKSIYEDVVRVLVERSADIRMGEELGPLITRGQYEKVVDTFSSAREEGVTVATGGYVPEDVGGGFFVPPTVYTDVDPSSPLVREEIFGPVLVVLPFESEADAVRLANDSEYGLAAGLWTRDLARALRVSELLEAGQVYVNLWSATHMAPFGGYKLSGYGREKGFEALREYTQVKCVTIAT